MGFSHEELEKTTSSSLLSRRAFIKLSLSLASIPVAFAYQDKGAATLTPSSDLLTEFLGEQLEYHIGFWLLSHCGEARVTFCQSPAKGIYIARMSGRTAGFVDWLIGHYRYSYISYAGYDKKTDRLYPLHFKLIKKRKDRVNTRTITFNYKNQELIFAHRTAEGKEGHKIVAMEKGILYEDYLTLFYNFRHGFYGPLIRGMTYHLPLHIHEGFDYLDLTVGSKEEQETAMANELNPKGKDYFVRFTVLKEDVSSKSGKIFGWLSRERVPVKGVIKDVVFFGDLWGVLINRSFSQKQCNESTLS